mmetsp:Transcript_68957/g.166734  ORF Transcript_68957/g.166734 Transcript_68957/m.166734 type:complete len:205 (-) Transcript_68957:1-615(-)
MGAAQSGAYDPRTPAFKVQAQRRRRPSQCRRASVASPAGAADQPPAFHTPRAAAAALVRVDLEGMLVELFRLHDINANGLLEEEELVELNIMVAKLHYGDGVDVIEIGDKYRTLFREHLDATGAPVPYCVFRRYMVQVLNEFDKDLRAQEMIAEQLGAEAKVARELLPEEPRLERPAPCKAEEVFHEPSALKCSPRRQAARGGA